MAKLDKYIESLKDKQLVATVFDDSEQAVLEEGTILGSAELLILKSRGIALEKVETQKPINASLRSSLFDQLASELLLELDYPGKLGIAAQIGENIDEEVLKQLRKLRICPSFYLKRTFRGAPFDIVAPMADPGDFKVVLPKKASLTLGILKSLVRSGFNLFGLLLNTKARAHIYSELTEKILVKSRTKLTKAQLRKLEYTAMGVPLPASSRQTTFKETIVAPDRQVLTFKSEKINHALLSRIREYSLRLCRPDIYSMLEGRPSPVNIVKIAGKREELRPLYLLDMFAQPGFDISLLYRNLGMTELSHWFDPFLTLILKEFGGGRVIQKTGSAYDPNNPLRKYHGLIKIKLVEEGMPVKRMSGRMTAVKKMRQLTKPDRGRKLSPREKTRAAGGRFLGLMCIIEHKRKVPTIFYHATLREDIAAVKALLGKISKKLDLEGGLRVQEGRLL